MATAEVLRFSPFGPGNSLRSYSATRSASPLRVVEKEMLRSTANSQYLRRVQRLEVLIEQTKLLSQIGANWDSYGAEAPNITSITSAVNFLITGKLDLLPIRAIQSAEGGVALSFAAGEKRALLEFLNSGTVDLMLYDNLGNLSPEFSESDDIEKVVSAIHFHLTR